MDALERIERLLTGPLADMGYDMVRVRITGAQRRTLQIMADRLDGAAMSVDDCARISRAVSAILDVEDPIPGSYTLEVSSPGIDRPLTRPRDFERFAGFEAKLELQETVDGRRRFQGRLAGFDNGAVRLEMDGAEVALPFAAVRNAKLVLTDELVAAAAAGTLGQTAAPEDMKRDA